MRKTLTIILLALLVPCSALAAKQTISNGETMGTARSKINANFTELYNLVGTRPWVIQSTAPADTTLLWFDDDQEVGYLVLKVHNGTTWIAQAVGAGGSYTLPVATASVLGGVMKGNGISIAGDGTASIDSTYTQRRVSSSCSAGSSIRAIAEDGTVTCETDDTGTGSVPSGTVNGQILVWATDQWITQAAPTLGTAAALNHGTAIGNVVRLVDDGEGNPALPFALDLASLTDVTSILSGKANASCFASESAFNACFDLTWATGGARNLDGLSDVVISGTPTTDYVLKFNGTNWAPAPDATAAGAGYVATPPTYSDQNCTAGQYSVDASYFYFCEATNQWDRFAVTWANWSNPTPVTPTLTSRVIGTNGSTLTLTGSASLSVGAGGNGGFDVDCSTAGNGITATYSSGAPGTSLVYTLGTTINSGDTCDLDYTQPGNGIEATTGGADLASITSAAITNNSTQSASVSVTDNFNRANGALGSSWTATGTTGAFSDGTPVIDSNVIVGPGYGIVAAAYYSGATFANNQYASAETITASGGTNARGPAVRLAAGPDGYYGTCYVIAGTDTRCQLYRIDDGTLTQLGSNWEQGGTANLLPNKVIRVEANGSTIKLHLNGTERISVTDATYTGGYPGIRVESTSQTENMDNFAAGDL